MRTFNETPRHTDPIPDGWSVDSDLWLVRRLRPNDPPATWWASHKTLSNHGFIVDRKVYAREVSDAREFDAATKGA